MRLIDADALRDNLQALAYDDWNQGVTTSWADAYSEVADMVETMPTIERKTGKWIIISAPSEGYCGYIKCPFCGTGYIEDDYNFCPNCGAQMEGEA